MRFNTVNKLLFILIIAGIFFASSCGFEEETNYLPPYYKDTDSPYIVSISPENGSKIDINTTQIVIEYSEEVMGADNPDNYSLSGDNIGSLSVKSVTSLNNNRYSINLDGIPGDGQITLSIENVTDLAGHSLTGNTTFNFLGWWNSNWSHRRKLTFDNSSQSEDLINFPVMVHLNSSRIDYSFTQSNGEDIRFIDTDGTILSYEIEKWDESGDSIVWVKVPQINGASSSDYIYMYYGNTNATDGQNANEVWDSTYNGVWHLKEPSGGPYIDSTGNGYTGIGEGTMTHIDNGAVDGAQDSDAGYDRISISISITNPVTVSAWGKLDAQGDMLWCVGSGNSGYDLWFTNNNIYLNIWQGTNSPYVAQPSNVNLWHYYTVVIDSSSTKIYIDGEYKGPLYFPNRTGSILYIGSSSTSYTWDGSVDEFRVSDSIKSEDWIAAQYLSMSDTFITYGDEE